MADSVVLISATSTRIQTSDFARRFAGLKLADLDGSAVEVLTNGWVALAA